MPPKKKIAALVKVQLQAGAATPAPPVGTALGPHGVNIMDFCKAYNAQTETMRGNVIPVEITIYEDRSFTFITKTPPAAELIKKAAGLQKGSGVPHKEKVGKLTKDQVREIATTKMPDLNANDDGGRDEDRRGHRPLHGRRIVDQPRWSTGPHPSTSEQPWQGRAGPLTTPGQPRTKREPVMQRSKTYRAATDTYDKAEVYAPLAAIKIAKGTSKKKFDETVDVVMRLGVDPRKADQMVRGTVNLPHGTGKTARVLVFANAEKAEAAREAGADVVGGDELIEKVNGGWLEFDAVVATPDMMGKVGRLGRVLGPRGLMPNPKTGTVTPDVAKAVSDIKGGKIEFRVDRHANLHFIIGKASFGEAQLAENYAAALEEVLRLKPASSKGRYIRKVTVSTTMGPGVQVDPNRTRNVTVEDEAAPGLTRYPPQPSRRSSTSRSETREPSMSKRPWRNFLRNSRSRPDDPCRFFSSVTTVHSRIRSSPLTS